MQLLSGCASSPDTQLFLIEPISFEERPPLGKPLSIGVGPVELAEHLNQKEILTHHQRYRVNTSEYNRWAEPLSENITAVLVENLVQLIPSDSIFGYQRDFGYQTDFRIRVNIVKFGLDPAGRMELNAFWVIQDSAGNSAEFRKSRFSEALIGDDVDSIVAAMSRALGQLSLDIAAAFDDVASGSSESAAFVPGKRELGK
jgi:hypothetical protein